VIAAAVIALLGTPSIWKIGIDEKTAYNAVKHTMRATSFAASFLVRGTSAIPAFLFVET
jgi:hypothetical protein